VDVSRVIQTAKNIREHGFFEGKSKCWSGPIRNQYGLTARGKQLAAAGAI